MSTLYETDEVAWAEEQVEKLRALAELRPNIDLDIEHLIEELEGIEVDRVQAARSHLRTALLHLFKLAYARDQDPRRGWRASVRNARDDLGVLLKPTVRRKLEEQYERVHERTREWAAAELHEYGDEDGARAVEASAGFTLDQVLDETFWP